MGEIKKEYSDELLTLKKQYDSLLGRYNNRKGLFESYLILEQLRPHSKDKNVLLKSIARNLPFASVKKLENIDRAVGFIFSHCGFTREAESYCKEKGIAITEDERWLEPGKLNPPFV